MGLGARTQESNKGHIFIHTDVSGSERKSQTVFEPSPKYFTQGQVNSFNEDTGFIRSHVKIVPVDPKNSDRKITSEPDE